MHGALGLPKFQMWKKYYAQVLFDIQTKKDVAHTLPLFSARFYMKLFSYFFEDPFEFTLLE